MFYKLKNLNDSTKYVSLAVGVWILDLPVYLIKKFKAIRGQLILLHCGIPFQKHCVLG